MPTIAKNARVVASAILGEKAVYQVAGSQGLHLAVLGDGKASWRLRYRPKRGANQKWHTLGDAQTITLGTASDKARDLMAALQIEGVDPAEQRKERDQSITFKQLAAEWLAAKEKAERRPSYIYNCKLRIMTLPALLLSKRANEVTRLDISEALDQAEERGKATTNATLRLLSGVLKWALSEGKIAVDPTAGVKKRSSDPARVRAFTDDELRAIWTGLNGSKKINEGTRLAITLCLFTGQRPNEIASLRRCDLALDIDMPTITVPDAQAKNCEPHILPLPKASVAALRRALAIAGEDCPVVFPSPTKKDNDGKPKSILPAALTRAITRAKAEGGGKLWGVKNAQLYDLKKTVSTWLGDRGYLNEAIGVLLNHVSSRTGTVTGKHYNSSTYISLKLEMIMRWAAHVDGVLGLGSGDAEAVSAASGMPRSTMAAV